MWVISVLSLEWVERTKSMIIADLTKGSKGRCLTPAYGYTRLVNTKEAKAYLH